MSVISKIRKLSKERGISLSFLCKALNVNKTYFIDIEKRNGNIPDEKLEKIAYTLFTSVSDLKSDSDFCEIHLPFCENKNVHVQINLSSIFDQNKLFTRYISHIWESWNDLLHTNKLLSNLIQYNPFGSSSDWVKVFKYIIISLNEAINVLNLEKSYNNYDFSGVRDYLIQNCGLNVDYEKFLKFLNNNKRFIINARNLFAHYDHEKNEHFSNFIKENCNYTGCISDETLSDINNPIALSLLIHLYKSCYNCESFDDNQIVINIVNIYTELSKHIIQIDKSILFYFFHEYTNFTNVLGTNDVVCLIKSVPNSFDVPIIEEQTLFWERFYSRCLEKNTKPNPLAKEVEISSGVITKWKTEGTLPNGETLIKIADYLDCSVDYLLGRTDVPEVNKKTAYVHHLDEQYSVPYIAAYGEGDVIPKGKFSDEDIEELKKRGRNH